MDTSPFLSTASNVEGDRSTPWLLACLAFSIPTIPPYLSVRGNSFASPARLISIAMLCLVIFSFLFLRRNGAMKFINPGTFYILSYLLIELSLHAASSSNYPIEFATGNKFVADNIIEHLGLVLACSGLALYSMTQIKDVGQRTVVLSSLMVGLIFACIVGALQSYASIDLRLLFEFPGMHETAQLGRPLGSGNVAITTRFGSPRAYSTANHPGTFAVMAAILVPLAVHFARFPANSWVRGMSILSIPVALAGVLSSGSRVGILVLIAAFLVYMWAFRLGDIVSAIIVGAAAAYFVIAAFPSSAKTLWTVITLGSAGEDPSVQARLDDYTAVEAVFSKQPVFGLGFGVNYPPGSDGSLDNQWLLALTQGGIVGISALLVLVFAGLRGLSAALKCDTTRRDRDQRYAIAAIIVGLFVSTTTSDSLRDQQFAFILFLLLGLLWSGTTTSVAMHGTRRSQRN